MGGGDLNSKKSWHPNTMKNQERVWKAEKAAAVEKQRIAELQRERAEERDRSDLCDIAKKTAGVAGDDRLSWMYNKPDKKGHQEDYLLGKTIDSNFEDKKEQDAIPAVSRRVVGSSMLSSGGDTQVDLARKMREDPLLLVKERERAARAALLNNPLQRKKLTELLRKDQEKRKDKKAPKEKKHKDLDDKLAAKLNALGDKGLNLAALLASGSSSETSSDEKSKKKKHKKDKKLKKKKKEKKISKTNHNDQDSSDDDDNQDKQSINHKNYNKEERRRATEKDKTSSNHENESSFRYQERNNRKASHPTASTRGQSRDCNSLNEKRSSLHRRSPSVGRRVDKYSKRQSPSVERHYKHSSNVGNSSNFRDRSPSAEKDRRHQASSKRRNSSVESRIGKKPKGLSAEERDARLAEMARAGAVHERDRSARVAQQRAAIAAEESAARAPRAAPPSRALPASLESRIHSNRHNIQRNERHMNEHFARR